MTDRTAFLAERRQGVGASDAAALLNVGWGCRRKLWYEKRGQEPDYPEPERPEFRRGHALEQIVLEEIANSTGLVCGFCFGEKLPHEQHEELFFHPDGLAWTNPSDARHGEGKYVEVKVLGRESFHRVKRDGLRDEYILQVQYALMVTGKPAMLVALFWPDGWQLLPPFEVQADFELGEHLRVEALNFWAQVQNGPAPDPLPEIDRRCQHCCYRRTCRGDELLAAVRTEPENELVQIDSLAPLVEAYDEARQIVADAEDHKEACAAKLRDALDKVTACEAPGWRVYFRPHEVSRWDGKQLDAWRAAFEENVRRWQKALPLGNGGRALSRTDFEAVVMMLENMATTLGLAKRKSVQRPLRIYPI